MSSRYPPLELPEPPPLRASLPVPEIFQHGQACSLRRAILLGNGLPGSEHQALGLIQALGLGQSYRIHRVTRPRGGFNSYLRWLPLDIHRRISGIVKSVPLLDLTQLRELLEALRVGGRGGWRRRRLTDGTDRTDGVRTNGEEAAAEEADAVRIAMMADQELSGEGPLLVVASGRDTVATSLKIKSLAPNSTFVVQIQHPHCDVTGFDIVVTPAHDYHAYTEDAKQQYSERILRWIRPPPPEKNVVLTVGALHHADAVALRSAAATWHSQLAALPRPLLAVNIGGPQRYCQYGEEVVRQFISALKQVLAFNGGCLRITFSPRTPAFTKELVESLLGDHPSVAIWDGRGPNPHLGHLAWADAFVVTSDSVNMLSEACSTGKPVYVVADDRCTWKFKELIGTLKKRGAIRTLTGFENMSETWSYPPLRDNSEAAAKIREAVASKGWTI